MFELNFRFSLGQPNTTPLGKGESLSIPLILEVCGEMTSKSKRNIVGGGRMKCSVCQCETTSLIWDAGVARCKDCHEKKESEKGCQLRIAVRIEPRRV